MIGEYLICPVHLKNDLKNKNQKKQEAGGDLEAPPEPEKEMSVFTPFIYQ